MIPDGHIDYDVNKTINKILNNTTIWRKENKTLI